MTVVLVPVLRRPHRVAALVENIRATSNAEPLFIASPDDTAEHQAVRDAEAHLLILDRPQGRGDYARKINAGIRATRDDVLLMGADDLLFHRGWLEAATKKLEPGIGVVGTNDLHNRRVVRGEHATHLLFTRDYVEQHGTIDEPGKLLHEGYWHEFVDDECVETAKHRGAWAFAADSHVEHLHPLYGGRAADGLDALHAQRMKFGQQLFNRRRHLWTT